MFLLLLVRVVWASILFVKLAPALRRAIKHFTIILEKRTHYLNISIFLPTSTALFLRAKDDDASVVDAVGLLGRKDKDPPIRDLRLVPVDAVGAGVPGKLLLALLLFTIRDRVVDCEGGFTGLLLVLEMMALLLLFISLSFGAVDVGFRIGMIF
jgi:hypothetical protein